MFTKVWPNSQTHEYFQYLEEVSYGEKLMGKSRDFTLFIKYLMN